MITEIQNFFLKHNKWLFGSLLVVIIVTFVLTIGPQSIFDSPSTQSRQRMEFFGYDLTSQSDQQVIFRHAELSMGLNPQLQLGREQLVDFAYLRVAGLGLAQRFGIPDPSREQLQSFIETLPIFRDPTTGEFSAGMYNRIIEAVESGGRFNRATLAAVLREDYRIDQVRRALGGIDFSLAFEVEQDYLDMQSTYTFVLAHYPEGSFQPEIELSEADIEQFYSENPSRYEIPEMITVTALLFNAESYIPEASEPTETAILEYFERNRSRWTDLTNEDGEPIEATVDDVRQLIVFDLRREQAVRIAAERASAFTLQLWRERVALNSPEFNALLEQYRVRRNTLEGYARDAAPQLGNIPKELLDSMWIYTGTSNRYFSDPVSTAMGAVVGVVEAVTPARMPSLEEVRDRVKADLIEAERRRLFADYGRELQAILAADPATFEEVAEGLGMTVEALVPFNGADVPWNLRMGGMWEQVQFLQQGEVSSMILNNNRGTFALLRSKLVPELDPNGETFTEFVNQRSEMLTRAMGWIRLREITDTGLERLMGTPLVRD